MHMKNSQILAEDTLQKVNQLFESNPAPMALSSLPERTFSEVFLFQLIVDHVFDPSRLLFMLGLSGRYVRICRKGGQMMNARMTLPVIVLMALMLMVAPVYAG